MKKCPKSKGYNIFFQKAKAKSKRAVLKCRPGPSNHADPVLQPWNNFRIYKNFIPFSCSPTTR
jgi:hypothetical protein